MSQMGQHTGRPLLLADRHRGLSLQQREGSIQNGIDIT